MKKANKKANKKLTWRYLVALFLKILNWNLCCDHNRLLEIILLWKGSRMPQYTSTIIIIKTPSEGISKSSVGVLAENYVDLAAYENTVCENLITDATIMKAQNTKYSHYGNYAKNIEWLYFEHLGQFILNVIIKCQMCVNLCSSFPHSLKTCG